MKTKLILAILLLSFKFGNSQTNVYHAFPDSNAIWIGTSWYDIGTCEVDDEYNLYISGDTIIGAYTYHKLYKNGFISAFMCSPSGNYYYGQYSGAFRQDVANKKIYLFKNGTDTLAYDFNLNVGDTLPLTCINDYGINNYVQSIDSVLIGSQYHKRFWLNNNYAALIEGIGSTLGVFDRIAPFFEAGSDLWCVRINNQNVWTSSLIIGENCGLTSTKEKSIGGNRILISKNPFSSETTLKSISNLENAILTIYNSSGQQVKQIKNINGLTMTLHRDNLLSGLYFIRLSQDNKIIAAEKLIIAD